MRVRTGYSFKAAFGHLHDVATRLAEIGWQDAPITDRCSTFGFVSWTKECRKIGLRPVYGVELAVVPRVGDKRPVVDYWCFLARESVRPLHDLIELATLNPGREASLTYDQALAARGLVKVSGERTLLELVPDGADDFYVGLTPATPVGLLRRARARGFSVVAGSDNYFPRQADGETYRVACGWRSTSQTYPLWIVSADEWRAAVAWHADEATRIEALTNQRRLLSECRAELVTAELLVPEKPRTLRQMCLDGAARLGVDLTREPYGPRLDHELAMIAEKKFEDYFYILADLISWAKERMIVGPARGSSCGSLTCYLLGITTIDPIPHDLLFERFIDVSREELPDVDVDFSDARRHLVFEYAAKKFGRDHVARLGNVNTFQARAALRQVAAALKIPSWRADKVTSSVIKRAQGDSRASQTIEDTLRHTDVGRDFLIDHPEAIVAARLEEHPVSASQHAAGVVVTRLPVAEHVAVDARTGAVMCDKKDAETLGLLKIDALGLTQLSVFERTLELIGERSVSGWLERLPLDDAAAFEVLNQKKWSGIFQFVGKAVKSLSTALLRGDKFRSLDDMVAITALARPGPMGGGGADAWIWRRVGKEPVSYASPLFEPFLRTTHGVVVYQEQVMSIGRLGGLSWEEVNKLRRAMSHSYGREFFDQFGDRWKTGMTELGVDKDILDKTWMELCNFGAMAFNKSHSVAYGTVSYWCCWLKAHHPVEFAAASLDALADPLLQIDMLRELREEGVDYVPFDRDRSTDRWEIADRDGRKILVGPLTAVRGVGPAVVAEVLSARKTGEELRGAVAKKLAAGTTQIDSLYPIRDEIERLSGGAANISVMTPTRVADVQEVGEGEVLLLGLVTRIDPTDENSLIRVQKRGGRKVAGPTTALHLYFRDDSGEMFVKVDRRDYERIGRDIVERGGAGKMLYAFRGRLFCNGEFSMMWVNRTKFIGEMGERRRPQETVPTEAAGRALAAG